MKSANSGDLLIVGGTVWWSEDGSRTEDLRGESHDRRTRAVQSMRARAADALWRGACEESACRLSGLLWHEVLRGRRRTVIEWVFVRFDEERGATLRQTPMW